MSFRIRAARKSDLGPLFDLAKLTGGGFTNLPADQATLEAKLQRSAAGFASDAGSPGEDLYVFMLENVDTGEIRGTCQVFGAVGTERPFYSYLISTLTQHSQELGRSFSNQTLNLTTDLEGSSEVGGLFLHPDERSGGLGLLLARSRYLFIRAHRERFGDTVLAELRGVMDEDGHSPFWDAIGGRFFGMTFPEADEFNAVHGTQFIADLFPKSPIYVSMLPEKAGAVIGQPHPSGKGAMRMLENEGFVWDGYVDIFDGGPTVTAKTDRIRGIRDARELTVVAKGSGGNRETLLLSSGRLDAFLACTAEVEIVGDNEVALDDTCRRLLEVEPGETILAVGR